MRGNHQIRRGAAALFGALCVLLLAACATPAPAASEQAAAAAATPALGGTRAWHSYTDRGLGYTLSFPQNVEFSSGTSKAGIYTARLQFQVPGVDGYQGMVLRVEPNPGRRGIEQVAEDLYRRNLLEEPPPDWARQLGRVTVGGLAGVQMGDESNFSLVVPYEDRVYILAPVHDTATRVSDPQALALFYQILATLRFAP